MKSAVDVDRLHFSSWSMLLMFIFTAVFITPELKKLYDVRKQQKLEEKLINKISFGRPLSI